MNANVQGPAPRGRKLQLGRLGTVVIAAAGVAAILWPERAEYLTKLGMAVAGLLSAVSAAMAYEDGQQAQAAASVQVAAANAANAGSGAKEAPTE